MTTRRKNSTRRKPSQNARPHAHASQPTRDLHDPDADWENLSPELAAAIETWMKNRGEAAGPLFLSDEGLEKMGRGEPLTEADGLSKDQIGKIASAQRARRKAARPSDDTLASGDH